MSRIDPTSDALRLLATDLERRRALRADRSAAAAERFEQIDIALRRVRIAGDSDRLLHAAARGICEATGLDRALISRVQGPALDPLALYERVPRLGPDRLTAMDARFLALGAGFAETEVVRKRAGIIVDALLPARALRPLFDGSYSSGYLVVPVTIDDEVVALIHADSAIDHRPITLRDLDAARLFVECLAMLVASADIRTRLEEQREELDATLLAAESMIRRMRESRVEFVPSLPRPVDIERRPVPSLRTVSGTRFTSREHEVLDLLARGYTNMQVADRLSVSGSTVKSHVKHIFKKLGASTRAEAIARYRHSTIERADARAS